MSHLRGASRHSIKPKPRASLKSRQQAAALNQALKELQDAGRKWDTALGQVAAASNAIPVAIQRAYAFHPSPDQVRQIESARGFTIDITRYKLRNFTGNGGTLALSPEKEELQYIVNHLPKAQE